MSDETDNLTQESTTAEKIAGEETWTWRAPGNHCTAIFGRPRFGTSEKIEKLLGPQQADNQSLVKRYRALSCIRSIDGQAVAEPMTQGDYTALQRRMGTDFSADDNVNHFVQMWGFALYTDLDRIMNEAREQGMLPDEILRIQRNAGVEQAKNLPETQP